MNGERSISIDVWGFRHLASRLLHYIKGYNLSYDLAYHKAIVDLSSDSKLPGSRRQAYYAGRDFISRYYTLSYIAEAVYGRMRRRDEYRRLADLWLHYFGQGLVDEGERDRFSKKISREAPGGRLPDLDYLLGNLDGVDRLAIELSYPRWFAAELASAMGMDGARRTMDSLNRESIWLRVNTTMTDVERAEEALRAEGVTTVRHGKLEYMLKVVESRRPVAKLKAVRAGYVTPQDLGSAMVAEELEDGDIIDMCSAPGGLAALFLMRRRGHVVGCDLSARRLHIELDLLQKWRMPIDRIGLAACDSTSYRTHGTFGQALLDAPCSGSGDLRRNPAIKIALERRSRLSYYSELQRRLLSNALRVAEIVVYSTCSVLPEEGEIIVKELGLEALDSRTGISGGYWGIGNRIYPHIDDSGGFFVARLKSKGLGLRGKQWPATDAR